MTGDWLMIKQVWILGLSACAALVPPAAADSVAVTAPANAEAKVTETRITDTRTWSNCQGGPAVWSDLRLTACSDLIKGGKAGGDDLAKAYYYRGNAQLTQSNYRKAADDFSRSLDIDRGNAGALHERCWALGVLGEKLDDALSDCNESLRLKPNDGETLAARAFVYLKLGFHRTAILDYDASLLVRPNIAEAHYGRALARAKAGDTDGAAADLTAARALDPKIDETFARLDAVSGGKGFWGALADYWRSMMRWVY